MWRSHRVLVYQTAIFEGGHSALSHLFKAVIIGHQKGLEGYCLFWVKLTYQSRITFDYKKTVLLLRVFVVDGP